MVGMLASSRKPDNNVSRCPQALRPSASCRAVLWSVKSLTRAASQWPPRAHRRASLGQRCFSNHPCQEARRS
eukprot:11183573-Lingulodinium_polyedra.AAC.1